jgi:predicted unusual protein kinase regulating ubiquinone biosynthesis (AarF/ABC1/UbiB family)
MQVIRPNVSLKSLYEIDENLWLEETIKLLKEHKLEELDLENLIEELENLGRRDKAKVASLLEQIIRHLLLLEYWQEEAQYNSGHWKAEIRSFRNQLKRNLTTNLYQYLESEFSSIYKDALGYVIDKTEGKLDSLPQNCNYSLEQLLDLNYLP